MLLIAGGTGRIGSEVLRLLLARGLKVRAFSRNPPADPVPVGVEWRAADMSDRASLEAGFEGGTCLFLVTGNSGDMVRLQKNAIRAAEAAGVAHVVKVSALGASDHSKSVIGVWHYNVERVLRESGLRWTILRPHVFMQNLLDQRQAIRQEHKIYSPSGEASIPMIDTRDIAAVAAEVLASPEEHAGARYTLSGPTPVSFEQAANMLGDVLGMPISYVRETETMAWNRLHDREGLPPWLVGAQLALAEYQRAGGGTDVVTDAVESLTGTPPRSFRQFVEDHADLFRGGA